MLRHAQSHVTAVCNTFETIYTHSLLSAVAAPVRSPSRCTRAWPRRAQHACRAAMHVLLGVAKPGLHGIHSSTSGSAALQRNRQYLLRCAQHSLTPLPVAQAALGRARSPRLGMPAHGLNCAQHQQPPGRPAVTRVLLRSGANLAVARAGRRRSGRQLPVVALLSSRLRRVMGGWGPVLRLMTN